MPKSNAAGVPEWVDPDDAPELTDAFFEQAEVWQGDVFVRRGRPRSPAPKEMVTVRLDKDLLNKLRAGGPGWQTRLNDVLRKAIL